MTLGPKPLPSSKRKRKLMSSNLPFTLTDVDNDKLTVRAFRGGFSAHTGALIKAEPVPGSVGHLVTKEEAPELALAILLAAGYSDDSHGGTIESAVATLASVGKKKAAEEALKAEALKLLNVMRAASFQSPKLESLDDVPSREAWIQIAKAARKIAAKKEVAK